MKTLMITAALATALGGCASVSMGEPAQDAARKQFTAPPPDKAAIYVYRNEMIGTAVKMDVSIDGQPIGQTVPKTYLYAEVSPGRHTITSSAENTDTVEVNLRPGALAYIWQEIKMGLLSARNQLHVVSEPEGQRGVRESKLAVK